MAAMFGGMKRTKAANNGTLRLVRKHPRETSWKTVGLATIVLASACTAVPRSTPPATLAQARPQAAPLNAPRPATTSPVVAARPAPRPSPPPPALSAVIQSLGQSFDGKVGIAVERVDAGWTVSHNGSQLFPQQSVSKLWVAMTLLDAVDRGKVSLTQPVTIQPKDLTLFHQPIAAMVKGPGGYTTSLSDLFFRAMTQSDNTANDSVLRSIGGSEAVRSFLARRYIANVRFGPGERLLQSQTAGLPWTQDLSQGRRFYTARANLPMSVRQKALDDYLANPPDGASPVAIAHALAKLKRGDMLSPASTAQLISTMGEAKTGPQRVKAGVPKGWKYVHKTGTGQDLGSRSTGYNDVGIMTAPDGTSYAIVVMIGSTKQPIPVRWALMQEVARTVAELHTS